MARRWWVSAIAAVGAWALTATAASAEPKCLADPQNIARRVLEMRSGQYVVSWDAIERSARSVGFDQNRGEKEHLLQPSYHGTRADIAPARNTWGSTSGLAIDDPQVLQAREEMSCGRITAEVHSYGPYPRLGYVTGTNYLVVWRDWAPAGWTTFHMVAVNETGRKEYLEATSGADPTYRPHGAIVANTAGASTAPNRQKVSGLSAAALKCVHAGLKACFIDSDSVWRASRSAGTPGGAGFLMLPAQPIFYSQPWTACVLFGCCCGGKQCHI